MFYTYLNNIVDIHARLKEHRVKNIKQAEWLSQQFIQSIEMRDYYKKHRDEAFANYWRKRSKFIIQKSKWRYFINSLKHWSLDIEGGGGGVYIELKKIIVP